MGWSGFKVRYAFLYDDKGEYLGKVKFKKWDNLFQFKKKSFNILRNEATKTLIKGFNWDWEVFQYNINNPNPLLLNKKAEPILNSDVYNVQLETKVARDLNNLANQGLFSKLTPTGILLILIVIGIIIWLATGHSITGT